MSTDAARWTCAAGRSATGGAWRTVGSIIFYESLKNMLPVMPAKAGIQKVLNLLAPGLRRGDRKREKAEISRKVVKLTN